MSGTSIQEGTQRDLGLLSSCTPGALIYPFIFTLATPTCRRSPVHVLSTYLIPLNLLMMYVRTRTPKKLERLVERTDHDLTEWKFLSEQGLCIWPVLWTHCLSGLGRVPLLMLISCGI